MRAREILLALGRRGNITWQARSPSVDLMQEHGGNNESMMCLDTVQGSIFATEGMAKRTR
jgi:hypothetical protein